MFQSHATRYQGNLMTNAGVRWHAIKRPQDLNV
ncbi:hypothetical protein CFT9_14193 [Pseudomonas sp. CFT9]|nr:hypothetical protein CFT9_14193 [Pseudomonas sp. CFT9]